MRGLLVTRAIGGQNGIQRTSVVILLCTKQCAVVNMPISCQLWLGLKREYHRRSPGILGLTPIPTRRSRSSSPSDHHNRHMGGDLEFEEGISTEKPRYTFGLTPVPTRRSRSSRPSDHHTTNIGGNLEFEEGISPEKPRYTFRLTPVPTRRSRTSRPSESHNWLTGPTY